ncbi:hypothetical protein N0V83_010740 [Neocucurbitaria cava]|uniref:Uncharacterized protein n=1 Tax=Neocucurbitaria cava TaxID=798079 RepID=A0A9W9CGZ3_9PLEO|nr:hypothetical protein N0V83_010740 [Neocucurbitaria cava]
MERPNPETDPDMFYPPRVPGWMDQVDLPEEAGYSYRHAKCPNCFQLKVQPHEDRECALSCATCGKSHTGKFCPARWMCWGWYKATAWRKPFEGEIRYVRPSEEDLPVLRRFDPGFFNKVMPIKEHHSLKRKREAEDEVEELDVPSLKRKYLEASRVSEVKQVLAAQAIHHKQENIRTLTREREAAEDRNKEQAEQLRQAHAQIRDLQAEIVRLSGRLREQILEGPHPTESSEEELPYQPIKVDSEE